MTMRHKPLQASSLHSATKLTPYLAAWRTLAGGAPMRSPEWLLNWWDVFAGPGDELYVILITESDGKLTGLAPLYRQKAGGHATMRVLGARDNCTHHIDWLSAAGRERQVGEAVARFLLQNRQDWKRLLFEAVDADADAVRATTDHLTGKDCLVHQRTINSSWKIVLPATWEEYLQTLSRSLRRQCRKLQRQFIDSGKIRLHLAKTQQDLQEGFQVLLDLHAARWGSTRQPLGVFSDRKFRSFHEAVAREMLTQGKLRLAWLECEGKPLAIEYQFFDNRAVYAYQAGVDLSMSEYAPGRLSMMAAIQFAMAQGCQVFDLLGGDEPYKANWRAAPTACHDLRVWQRGLRGYLECGLWNTYMMMARLFKPVLPDRLVRKVLKLSRSLKEASESKPSSDG
jgi:CelD/BcsL family acetyltransferase involved in cellulose biosynthesis